MALSQSVRQSVSCFLRKVDCIARKRMLAKEDEGGARCAADDCWHNTNQAMDQKRLSVREGEWKGERGKGVEVCER